jgi:acyl carrier protein
MNYDRAVLSDLACTLVADQLPYDDRREVQPESHLADDLGFDSLDVIELVMACEEEFDIIIEEEDSEKFATVQDLIDYLVRELIEPAA